MEINLKRTLCFEYYSIIACGLTNLNTWTFESLKKIYQPSDFLMVKIKIVGVRGV